MNLASAALDLGVAALGGLAVGVEREWSARQRKRQHDFAGVRTFLLLGLLGGLAGWLPGLGYGTAAAVLFAAGAMLAVAAYAVSAWRGDIEATTEVAALVVLAAGFLAGSGELVTASAISALTALVLMEKTRIHDLVFRLRSEEIEAGLRFAVLALVVLPLLPVGPYGPAPGFRPRELWGLVLVFSGLSFAGYAGQRIAGPDRGFALAGLLGGLVSSTAVTLDFSRASRRAPAFAKGLALGILAASTLVALRVAVIATAIAPDVGRAGAIYLAPPFLAGAAAAVALLRYRRGGEDTASPSAEPGNPLALGAALRMALLFQAVLYAVERSRGWFGSAGVLWSAAALGLTDMDALTFSMARLGTDPTQTSLAARALGVGLLSNTVLKTAIVAVLGAGAVRRFATLGLALIAAAGGAALLIF